MLAPFPCHVQVVITPEVYLRQVKQKTKPGLDETRKIVERERGAGVVSHVYVVTGIS